MCVCVCGVCVCVFLSFIKRKKLCHSTHMRGSLEEHDLVVEAEHGVDGEPDKPEGENREADNRNRSGGFFQQFDQRLNHNVTSAKHHSHEVAPITNHVGPKVLVFPHVTHRDVHVVRDLGPIRDGVRSGVCYLEQERAKGVDDEISWTP